MAGVTLRTATATDGPAIAEVLISARVAMSYLPLIHTDAEASPFIAGVLARSRVQVAVDEGDQGRVVAFAAVREGWLDHLYVLPDHQGAGLGTRLIAWAQETSPTGLDLWVFQRNTGAQALYERHGWRVVALTDGSDNEEKQPDAHMRWRGESRV
jgi:GNAT superfamily N-acetyltransferase